MSISQKQRSSKRKQLFEKNPYCAICKKRFPHIGKATLDHIFPKALGGSNALSNLQLAHRKCNNKRGMGL